jgi:ubiquinone/menaquinone biosynthesis C-methylase UbiE
MLAHAHARPEPVTWVQGCAEELGFADRSFDLIFSVDVIHHVAEKLAFYLEAVRALRPDGWICTVTDSEEIIRRREILSGYFPETVAIELERYPSMVQLEAWHGAAGLQALEVVTVEQPWALTSARPFRAKAYSSLHLISEEAWRAGLARLERDLEKGPILSTVRYACVWGRKPGCRLA